MSILKRFKQVVTPVAETNPEIGDGRRKRLASLTSREYEALTILMEGYTLRFCAEKMGIGYSTANTYQNAIYRKLDVNSRARLIIDYKDYVD